MPTGDDARPATLMAKPSWLISEVSRLAHPLITDKLATAGSRGYHYRLLAALQEFGPASQARLGRRTVMDRSDVVAAVNELAARGLVERAPDPDDRRRNVITMTPAGTAHPTDRGQTWRRTQLSNLRTRSSSPLTTRTATSTG